MEKKTEDVAERIIRCAREEFLEKGFTKASLRVIASKADTTTGSIYSRFGGKEELYEAIVKPAADYVTQMFQDIQENFHQMETVTQKEIMDDYTVSGMEQMLDYIYDHFEEFRLLLASSQGSRLQDFVEHLVELETEYTCRFMEDMGMSAENGVMTGDFMHIMNKALFESFFEVVRHNMPKEKAVCYIRMLAKYHSAGWEAIFSMTNS